MTTNEAKDAKKHYALRTRESDEFMVAFSEKVGEVHRSNTEKYISAQNVYRIRHGSSWSVHPATQNAREKFETVETSHAIKYLDIAENKIERILSAVNETAEGMHANFARRMYETIGSAAESVGNTVNATDHETLAEVIYAALEKIEFVSDKFGNVTPPTMHVSPSVGKKIQEISAIQDPETDAKFAALVAEKTKTALEAEALRKAKFVNYGEN